MIIEIMTTAKICKINKHLWQQSFPSIRSTQAESTLRISGKRASSLTPSEINVQMGKKEASDLFLGKLTKVRLVQKE